MRFRSPVISVGLLHFNATPEAAASEIALHSAAALRQHPFRSISSAGGVAKSAKLHPRRRPLASGEDSARSLAPPLIKRGLRSPLEHSPSLRGEGRRTGDEGFPAGRRRTKRRGISCGRRRTKDEGTGEDEASTSTLKMRETDARRPHPPPQSSTKSPSRADI